MGDALQMHREPPCILSYSRPRASVNFEAARHRRWIGGVAAPARPSCSLLATCSAIQLRPQSVGSPAHPDDVNVPVDNSARESGLRVVVLGRKKFLVVCDV